MSGKRSKELSRLAFESWTNFPEQVQQQFEPETVRTWFKQSYRALPRNQRSRWLRLVRRRLADGFSPVSPKALMPRKK